MPRQARIMHGGVPHHIIQRGNNRSACFFSEEDRGFYLESLSEGASRYGCAIHAYVLMTNHVHLLVTPIDGEGLSRMMRYLGSRYVQYVNYVYKRSGTLWEGRFKSSLVDSDHYLLTCSRYIEMNPVRAGLVAAPSDYKWSSYGAHACGRVDDLLQDHPTYLGLGKDGRERQEAYRSLFQHDVDDESLQSIRKAVNSGKVFGGERFKDQIEAVLAKSVRAGKPGRPRKRSAKADASEEGNPVWERG